MYTLLDTNILLRSGLGTIEGHAQAIAAVAALLATGRHLCISSQAIYEFLAVATKPVAENGLGLKQVDADRQLETLLKSIEVFYDSETVATELRRLVVTYQVVGKKTHDARMVATMHVHKITEILTFNGKDFVRYPGIIVLSPATVDVTSLSALPPGPSS